MNSMSSSWFWMQGGDSGFTVSREMNCGQSFVVAQGYLAQTNGDGLQRIYVDHYDYISPTLIYASSQVLTQYLNPSGYNNCPFLYADRVVKVVFVGGVGAHQNATFLTNLFNW